MDAEEQAEQQEPPADASLRGASSAGLLEAREERDHKHYLEDVIAVPIRKSGSPKDHKTPAVSTSLRSVGLAGSPKQSSSPSVEMTCGGEPTVEDNELEKRALGTDEFRKKLMGFTSLRSVDPAGNMTLEGQEESINFLKKQVDKTDRSRYDMRCLLAS